MRRAREGRETKRVSFSLRNCMFATLHVALTTRRKIVDCPTSTRPYEICSPDPPSSPKYEPDAGRLRSAALTSRLPRPDRAATAHWVLLLRAGSLGHTHALP